jgi:hypothetical protein
MRLLTKHEALIYFGLDGDEEELERIVAEYDLLVDLDGLGRIETVEAEPERLKEALFAEHERKVGHRPDDPEMMAYAEDELRRQDQEARTRMKQKTAIVKRRVTKRATGNGNGS